MDKLYTLNRNDKRAKKEIIDFLINFSKSMEIITINQKNFIISKN